MQPESRAFVIFFILHSSNDSHSWASYVPIEWELFQILISSLPLLPQVRDVTLFINYSEPHPRPQYLFQNLTSLTANFHSKCAWRQFYQYSLVRILHSSPNLTHLKLTNPAIGSGYASCDKAIEALPNPMRITDFTLAQLELPAISILLRHFRFLSSINLTETSSGNLEDLWTALNGENIHLLKIGCDKISGELFDYLLSYDGLQSLMLRFEEDSPRGDALAGVFFSQVLPHHHKTITRLVLQPEFEGVWSFGEQTSAAVFQCTRLRFLWMTVRVSQLDLAPQLVESAHLFEELEDLYVQCPSSFSKRAPETSHGDRYGAKRVMEDMIVGLEVPARDPYRWLKVGIEPLGSSMKAVQKNDKLVFDLDGPPRGYRG